MSANSNNSSYSNYYVGTNSIQNTNGKNCETVLRKGSYSSNISFPVVNQAPSQMQQRQGSQPRPFINVYENNQVYNCNQCNLLTSEVKESLNVEDSYCHSPDLHDHQPLQSAEKVPSFFNRILAPPTAFADDRNRRKGKEFFGSPTSTIIEDLPTRGTGSTSFVTTATKLAQRQQQTHFTSPNTKTNIRNLNIFSPSTTTNSANFSSYIPLEFSYPSFDDMGWGQPSVVGKRVRSDTLETNPNSGYSASESETDEEMRVHLHNKRSRDVSPIKSTHAIADFTNLPSHHHPIQHHPSCPISDSSFRRGCDCGSTATSDSLEPSSSLSSESYNYHSTSIISTTTNVMTAQDYSPDVEFDPLLTSPRHQMLYNFHHQQQENTPYMNRCLPPSDCFLDPHRKIVFTTQSSSDDFHTTTTRDHMPKLSSIQISDHVNHHLHHHHETIPRAQDCVPIPGSERTMSSSSSSASSVSATLQDVRISPPRSGSKYKGPRVSTARGIRSSQKNYSGRKHVSPSYAIIKSAKNPIQTATTMGKDVNESEEEDDSEYEGGDTVVDDTASGLKGDEAIEDDASTSTDIALPNIVRKIVPAIRPSYFPNVPPYINFCSHDEKSETLPTEIRKHLKWRMSTITPVVIRKTVSNSGFRLLKKTVDWGGQWGKHMKATMFRSTLKEHQKLNHLPGTFQLGRKDRLWKNIYRFILKYGKTQYGFLPRTYILPHDMKQLKHAWDAGESRGSMWIVKPPAAARGTGIRVINKWNIVPKKRPMIVQQYIAKPLLINDRKFDLRLYVLVTSFHPLRVYLFQDGLVRFAPVKYSHDSKRVGDRFMHLTNYSINKNCDLYTQNEDANACKGHKWTLKTLWRYLRSQGTETGTIIKRIEDIVIKTLISAEECITNACFHMPNRYNGYELFGFDIILDETYKPWLLEVNISPSLHSSSPLDLAVKGQLVKEVFNIVGYHLPNSIKKTSQKTFVERLDKDLELEKPTWDKRIYTTVTTKEEKMKQQMFRAKYDDRVQYLTDILETLTPDDIRHLITAEDELSQCDGFTRIFPTRNTYSYFAFFEGQPRYYNMLMDAWENKYELDRAPAVYRLQELCRRKIHLITAHVVSQPTSESQDGIAEERVAESIQVDKSFSSESPSETTIHRSDPSPTAVSGLTYTAQNQSPNQILHVQNHHNQNHSESPKDEQIESSLYFNSKLDNTELMSSGYSPLSTTTCTTNTNLNIPRGIPAVKMERHIGMVRPLTTQPQQQPVPQLAKSLPMSTALSPHAMDYHDHHDENNIINNNGVNNSNSANIQNTPVNEYNKIKGICY